MYVQRRSVRRPRTRRSVRRPGAFYASWPRLYFAIAARLPFAIDGRDGNPRHSTGSRQQLGRSQLHACSAATDICKTSREQVGCVQCPHVEETAQGQMAPRRACHRQHMATGGATRLGCVVLDCLTSPDLVCGAATSAVRACLASQRRGCLMGSLARRERLTARLFNRALAEL